MWRQPKLRKDTQPACVTEHAAACLKRDRFCHFSSHEKEKPSGNTLSLSPHVAVFSSQMEKKIWGKFAVLKIIVCDWIEFFNKYVCGPITTESTASFNYQINKFALLMIKNGNNL